MSHPASEFCSNSQIHYRSSKNLIPRCKAILFRWFSPLERLISSDGDELPKNEKQWKRFSVTEVVDNLFSENPATRAWALRKTRQLMVDFPDRLMFNVIRIKTPPNRNRRLKTALASLILQFEHPIATFGSEFTPPLIAQLFYPDPESIRCVFDAWRNSVRGWNRELDCSVELSVIKSIVKQTNPNTSVAALRLLAAITMSVCYDADPLSQEYAYEEMTPALKFLIQQNDTEVLMYTALVVQFFTYQESRSLLLIDAEILRHLIPLLSHSHPTVVVCAIEGLRHITARSNEQRQAVWDCGFVNHFPNTLKNGIEYAFESMFICLSNLAAGNRELLCELLERGLFPKTVNHTIHKDIPALTADSLVNYDSCKEVPSVINECVISVLCSALYGIPSDISVALHCLSKILSNAGTQVEEVKKQIAVRYHTIEIIEDLQWSVNDDESRLSYHFMEDCLG